MFYVLRIDSAGYGVEGFKAEVHALWCFEVREVLSVGARDGYSVAVAHVGAAC